MEKLNKRKNNIDLLRIISSFMVVLLHTAAMGPLLVNEKGFMQTAVINSITRFCVPVFVMISGYFMLEKEKVPSFYVKRAVKLIFTMVCWSVLYLIKYTVTGVLSPDSIKTVLIYLFTEPVHLWYFYMLSALLLFTPFIQTFCKNADKKMYIYTLTLMFVAGCILTPLLNSRVGSFVDLITGKMKIGTLMAFPMYYMFGYFIKRFGLKRKYAVLSLLIGLLLTVAGLVLMSFKKGFLDERLISFYAPNVAIFAMGMFALFCNFDTEKAAPVKYVAPLTGGIYGIHMIFLSSVYEKTDFINVAGVRIILSAVITFIVSGTVIFIFKTLKKGIHKIHLF